MPGIAHYDPYVVVGGLDPHCRRQLVPALTGAGVVVVAEAATPGEVIARFVRWEANAAVLDLHLGPAEVLLALREIKAQLSSARVIVIADDSRYRTRFLTAGAEAIIMRDENAVGEVVAALTRRG